jgi:citrate lyase beta subunit
MFGADDMAASLGATRTSGDPEVEYERRELVLYCAAFDLQCIDTPWVNIQDLDGLREDTERVMHLGYTGRLVIHPSHLEPINEIFTPPDEAIDFARRMIQAHDQHQAQGKGVFVFEGRMIDMPGIRQSERVLARAQAASRL